MSKVRANSLYLEGMPRHKYSARTTGFVIEEDMLAFQCKTITNSRNTKPLVAGEVTEQANEQVASAVAACPSEAAFEGSGVAAVGSAAAVAS